MVLQYLIKKTLLLICFIILFFICSQPSFAQFTQVDPGTVNNSPTYKCSGNTTLRTKNGTSLCCVSLTITTQFCQEYCSRFDSGWQSGCRNITSCTAVQGSNPYPDGVVNTYCYQDVVATYSDGSTYNKYVSWDGVAPELVSVKSCNFNGTTYNQGNYCPVGGTDGCIPINSQNKSDNGICCMINGSINLTYNSIDCDVVAKKCPTPESDYHLLQNSVCCKKPSAATINSNCARLGKTDCKVNESSYSYPTINLGCLTSSCKCTVDIVSASEPTKKVNIYTDTGTPNVDPDGGNVPDPGDGGNQQEAIPECADASCVCQKYAATLDQSKRADEQKNCEACYSANPTDGRALYQYTALGCINVSTQGLIVNILRIFYGIGTGLLVFRIVMAGVKLLNEPDSPGVLKDSREEITASILAFVFGVMSVVVLRFFGINVLGLTWLENLFPVIG